MQLFSSGAISTGEAFGTVADMPTREESHSNIFMPFGLANTSTNKALWYYLSMNAQSSDVWFNSVGAFLSTSNDLLWQTVCDVTGSGKFIGFVTPARSSTCTVRVRVTYDGQVEEIVSTLANAMRLVIGAMKGGTNTGYNGLTLDVNKGNLVNHKGLAFKQSLKVEVKFDDGTYSSSGFRQQCGAFYYVND